MAAERKKCELQVGSMANPCMITTFGSEFDGPKARSSSARIAVPDGVSVAALRAMDQEGADAAQAQGREYSSFFVGTCRDGVTPIIRAKITRDARGYSGEVDCGAPTDPANLTDGCSLLLKVSPFRWTREDPKYGPKMGITLYGNTVYCGGRLDSYNLTEGEPTQKPKAVVQWD